MKSCQMGGPCCNVRLWEGWGPWHVKLRNPRAAWYFNFYFKRVAVTLACTGPLWYARHPAEDELFPKEPGIRRSWNVTPPPLTHTTHSLSFSTPPADHCQITICIIICSAQKRKLTPKFYGSTNCNNQCFIAYTKAKISGTIMVEELSVYPSSPFSVNSIQLLYWHDCLSETIFKKCKFIPRPRLTKKTRPEQPPSRFLSTWANTFRLLRECLRCIQDCIPSSSLPCLLLFSPQQKRSLI